MLTSVINFLPLATCLFWLHLHVVMAHRAGTFAAFICFLSAVALFLFTDCCYYDMSSSFRLLTTTNNLAQIFAPSIIPLLLIYILRMRNGQDVRLRQMIWVFIPIVLFTIAELTTNLEGKDNLEEFIRSLYIQGPSILTADTDPALIRYHLFTVVVFRFVIFFEIFYLLMAYSSIARKDGYRLRHLWNFLFRDGSIDMVGLQFANLFPLLIICILKLCLFRDYLQDHQWISLTMSVLMAVFLCPFCFTALFGSKRRITTRQMRTALRYNYNPKDKDRILEGMLTEMLGEASDRTLLKLHDKYGLRVESLMSSSAEKAVDIHELPHTELFLTDDNRTDDADSLTGRFERLMLDEKLFLQHGLTLEEVSEQLHSNKTYVSKMVNGNYGIGFPELVNRLRIDYAKDYLEGHPDARQEDIAKACGFPSASSFNNTFKKITGMPPRIWLATHEHRDA